MELSPSMTRNEYQKNRDTLNNLYLIRSLLESSKLINTSSKANIQTQANTQVNKRSSDNAVSPVINVEGVSTVINELPVLSQVVNEKSDILSENPGLESAGSKQVEKNVLAEKGEGDIEQTGAPGSSNDNNPLDNGTNGEKNSTFKTDEQDTKPAPILEPVPSVANENSGQVNNVQSNGRQSDNQNNKDIQDVSATASNQVTPVSEDVSQDIQSEILVPLSSVSPNVGNVSTAKNINDNMVASEISEQEDGTQTTTRQQEPNPIPTPTPAPGLTPDLTQDPILTPTLVPTPNLTPTPNPVPTPEPVPPVANGSSGQVGDTKTNGKLPNNPGNGSITATQNTQKSKWPTITTWTLAVAGVVSGVAIAVYLEMLAAGIAVGACCLVAAAVIYYCTPKSSVENSNVETVKTAELTAQ